jgi:hypothetical protein
MYFGDEMLKHFLCDLEIRDNAILERANCLNIAWRSPKHTLGFPTDRFDGFHTVVYANSNNGGLIKDNAFVLDVN